MSVYHIHLIGDMSATGHFKEEAIFAVLRKKLHSRLGAVSVEIPTPSVPNADYALQPRSIILLMRAGR